MKKIVFLIFVATLFVSCFAPKKEMIVIQQWHNIVSQNYYVAGIVDEPDSVQYIVSKKYKPFRQLKIGQTIYVTEKQLKKGNIAWQEDQNDD